MFVEDPRWRQFVADHAPRYQETVFLPALVAAPRGITERITAAVATATTSGAKGLRLRGFRGSEFDFKLTENLSRTPPRDDQSLTEWLADSADGRPACVAINDVSSWDLGLAALARSVVRSLTPDRDLVSGADIYTFIADVEWTPFGIHKDDEPSLIFHLGPGHKELWVWPADGIDPHQLFENPSLGKVSIASCPERVATSCVRVTSCAFREGATTSSATRARRCSWGSRSFRPISENHSRTC